MSIISILEEEEKMKGTESLFKQILDEDFPNSTGLGKTISLNTKKANRYLVTLIQ